MNNYMKVENLLDLEHTIAKPLFEGIEYPWEMLSDIKNFILNIGPALPQSEYIKKGEDIWISKEAVIYDTAYIKGPCIIGAGTEVRHCAFIRGSVIVGEDCVVGNSCEIKNSILFDHVQVPHFNYVGDSVLGYYSHMGAGSVTSNVKSDKTLVSVRCMGEKIETGRKKFGAIIGNHVEVGCNSVLCPGTVIGAYSNIYPLSNVRGFVPGKHIYKNSDNIVGKTEKE